MVFKILYSTSIRSKASVAVCSSFAITAATLLWADLGNRFVWATMLVTLAFGLIGFWDDYLKVSKRNPKGVPGKIKFVLATAAVFLPLPPVVLVSALLVFPFPVYVSLLPVNLLSKLPLLVFHLAPTPPCLRRRTLTILPGPRLRRRLRPAGHRPTPIWSVRGSSR